MLNYQMLINGEWVDAESGKTMTVINPANEEVIATIPMGDEADVNKAVIAARKAFPAWSKKTQAERSRMVFKIAEAVREHGKELATIESLDHGAPISAAYNFQVPACAAHFEYAAHASTAVTGDVVPVKEHTLTYVKREPLGVCALIIPWNYPLLIVAEKLGAALAMGNTCIIKPPSIEALSTLTLVKIIDKLGFPPGVINVITGSGGTVGNLLASHPGIDKIGFTGSTDTGKAIISKSSSNVKRLQLELGGKNPFIVLEDADIDAAVNGAIFASFSNIGMVCSSPGRYYVHEKVHDEFVEKVVAAARKIVVGDPMDPVTEMGPVVSIEHRDSVESYIKTGIEEGAKLVLGGERPTNPALSKGYYILPTVFTGVTQNMRIAREEIFGPVVCILKYSDADDVVALANDTVFGLAASVWTRDLAKGIRYADEIRAGTVWINEHLIKAAELPWGGARESGFGIENSMHGLYEYTQLKVIFAELSEGSYKPWHAL